MPKPRTKVTNLAIKRDGDTIKASWKNPADLTKGSYCAYWIDSMFHFDREGVNKKWTEVDVWYNARGKQHPISYKAADRFHVKGSIYAQNPLLTSQDKGYDRSRFHPVSSGKYLKQVKVGVYGGDDNGTGPTAWATYKMSLPKKPKVSWAYDDDKAIATVTVETDAGKDHYERYDTRIKVEIRQKNGKTKVLAKWFSTKSIKWKKSWDLSSYITGLQAGQYVTIKCYAYARGMAGDNPSSSKAVTAERSVVFPLAGTVGKPTCDKKKAGGRIKVPVSSDSWSKQLQLQRKVDDGNWSDVSGAVDNQNAKALYDSYGDVLPSPGQRVYYRIKATRDNFTNYSASVRADCIYTAPAKETCTATCKLLSLKSNGEGTQVSVRMGWKDSTSNTGCELSWSKYPNGWNTTEAPNTVQLTGRTGKADGWNYRDHTITGLTPGDVIYVRMRRYKTYSSDTQYSAYDAKNATKVVTESATDDACSILSIDVTGATAKLSIGINEDSENEGTEITWADNSDAWQSNEQPNSFNATWGREPSGDQTWPYAQTVYLRGLEAGRTYWVRARRYTGTTFSGYSATKQFSIPSGASQANYDPRCGLVSVEPGSDGHSATVIIGWDGDHTGCEASWSDNPDAWESSDQPSTFEYTWEDSENKSPYDYSLTADTAVQDGKTYYTRSGAGTDESPYVYTVVANPSTESIASYYERIYEWSHTSTCHISGLDEGVTYYIRARSYFEGEDTVFSEYTSDMSVTPFSAPESVVLDAPSAIARGNAIECWWEVSGEIEQVEWHLHDASSPLVAMAEGTGSLCHASIDPDRYGDSDAISFYVEAGCGGGLTQSNTVTVGIADIPMCAATYADADQQNPVWDNGTLVKQGASFEVLTDDQGARLLATCYSMGCTLQAPDGDYDQLEGDAVWTQASTPAWTGVRWDATNLHSALGTAKTAADAAETAALTAFSDTEEYDAMSDAKDESDASEATMVAAKAVLDALSPGDEGYAEALEAYETAEAAYREDLDAYLQAYDAAYATDEGLAYQDAQAAAEAATAALNAHSAGDTVYRAVVSMPVCELYDGGMYYAEFKAVESVAGLSSDAAIFEFPVAYSHQAPEPSASIVLTVDSEARKVTINLAEPQYAAETDVYDIYRQTPSGYEEIAHGLELDAETCDPYAPFGHADTAYRIACRTVDGDISWAEYAYEMPVYLLRFDWGSDFAEFPFNVEIREQMQKDYESRRHVDGSMNGYWDRGVSVSGSYTTDIVKVNDSELLRQARKLGSYAGAVWVRDAYGKAMQCNVEVNEVSLGYRTKAVGLSFGISAMKTTQQFMPTGEEEPNG